MRNEILRVENLSFSYWKRAGFFASREEHKIFENIDFSIGEGEALGLLGDSGCGKSTLAKCLMRLAKPKKGEILFEGRPILNRPKEESVKRHKQIQIVFQDSASTLNPSWLVHFLLEEPLKLHHPHLSGEERRNRVLLLLKWVGLSPDLARRLPGELSGGQRQRVNIARALAVEPRLLILDEPVSQLDASVQNSILKLLIDLQEKQKLSYLLISHDLRVLRMVCHRILNMEKGKLISV